MHRVCRKVIAELVLLSAVLKRATVAAIEATLSLTLEALPGEAVLHLKGDCTAEGVETKDWIVGPDVRAIDSDLGNKIPIDRVAERLVDADAILVNGEPLGCSLQGRSRKTSIAQILE